MHNNLLLAQPSDEKLYVEDVFSTWLYTGNGSSQTITNGIDLAGKGGMVWLKDRTSANPAWIMDTLRGTSSTLQPSSTNGAGTISTAITAFNANGFAIGANGNSNTNNNNYASWTFRKAPKFFDVVTFTYAPTAYPGKSITHNLGSTPGMIIVKSTTLGTGGGASWYVSHRATPNPYVDDLYLNSTAAASSNNGSINGVTSTAFNFIGGGTAGVTQTYVAYLFAHDTTADGVIQCGSFTTDASGNATVNLGWEPQFVLFKGSDISDATSGNWWIQDNMRGYSVRSGPSNYLTANQSNAEVAANSALTYPTSTGFVFNQGTSGFLSKNFIYLAIRRGPMRVPTDATKVYSGVLTTPASSTTTAFSPDLAIVRPRSGGQNNLWFDRMRGPLYWIRSDGSSAEVSQPNSLTSFGQNGVVLGSFWSGVGSTIVQHFKRAPGFMDCLCYTGTGATRNVNHNLGVTPDLIMIKSRSANASWIVQSSQFENGFSYDTSTGTYGFAANLNSTAMPSSQGYVSGVTATVFGLNGGGAAYNASAGAYVAYLFASRPGVSKIGSYTGNGSSLNIDCGFTNGARFVLIKRTDAIGDWFTFDTARGIVTANDPYLLLNSTTAEVTTNDSIDALSSGFTVNQVAATNINVSGGTYLYLAIA